MKEEGRKERKKTYVISFCVLWNLNQFCKPLSLLQNPMINIQILIYFKMFSLLWRKFITKRYYTWVRIKIELYTHTALDRVMIFMRKHHYQIPSWRERVYLTYTLILSTIIEENQDRNSNMAGSWRKELVEWPWKDTAYLIAPDACLFTLHFYKTWDQHPMDSNTYSGCKSLIMKMFYRLTHSSILIIVFCSLRFPLLRWLKLCQVYINTALYIGTNAASSMPCLSFQYI